MWDCFSLAMLHFKERAELGRVYTRLSMGQPQNDCKQGLRLSIIP